MLKSLFRKKETVDMTEGNILSHLITFAIPLLIGNLFQQLYNMVDTWVVGNFASNEAFAAVGSLGPALNMVIGFFIGLSSGAGIVVSQYYGAGKHDKVKETVHTAALLTIICSVIMTVAGLLLIPYIRYMMNIPDEVWPEAEAYMRVYFSGVTGLVIYNIGAGILRAVGDSRRPLYFLIVTTLLNTVLDLILVKPFSDMGYASAGVALATIIAQGVSAILVVITLMRTKTSIRLIPRELKLNTEILIKIFRVGVPSGLQMLVTSFSNVFVQSYINYFNADYMSGWTAYNKLDAILFLPMQSFGLSATTFVGQNLGKNQIKRAKKGSNIALLAAFVVTAVLMVPILLFPGQMIAFFNDKKEVVDIGTMLLTRITPFYILCAVNQVYSAALRGAGNSKVPMIIMLSSFVAFRQIYLFFMTKWFPDDFLIVALSYPAGWLLCSLLTFIYYKLTPLKSTLMDSDEMGKGNETE